MILVDTSVWVEHLRHGLPRLATLLQGGEVLIHPGVIGELACGNLRNRSQVLDLLQGLPMATVASDAEVLLLIEREQLMARAAATGSMLLDGFRELQQQHEREASLST